MTNKELILKFYDEVFMGKDLTRLSDYMRDDYIQHNPTVKDGLEGFVEFTTKRFFLNNYRMDIKRILVDGDMVLVHFNILFPDRPESKGSAVADIYRIQDGKLAEHWDVLQPVPDAEPANPNTMF